MRKMLPWIIGLVAGAALGVSGTYAGERLTSEDSTPCKAWSSYLNDWPTVDNSKVPNSVRFKVGFYSKDFLDYWDQLLTIRNKACQR